MDKIFKVTYGRELHEKNGSAEGSESICHCTIVCHTVCGKEVDVLWSEQSSIYNGNFE